MQFYSVDQLFQFQVAQNPNHPAIVTSTQTYSYQDLNQLANQIAHSIFISQSRIGLLFDQSAIAIAAILGVLKSGNAYVPLDPTFPKERTSMIVEDVQIDLLLTTTEYLSVARQLVSCAVIDVKTIHPATCCENLNREIDLDSLALILYTSGSTGTPKGVMHSHRTIVHNHWRQREIAKFDSSDRMSLLYSPSVMGSVRGTFNALLAGATLYPYSLNAQGLLRFVELIQQEQLTIIHCVASLFRSVTSVLTGAENLSALRLVITGGEAAKLQDFDDFKQYFPIGCQFHVSMGSTECGTMCAQLLNHNSQVASALIPPGYAYRDIAIKILDENGLELPTGEMGEIAIESAYLALGYWNRPDLNEAAFESLGTVRRFKTGDLGQLLPDGQLIHHGRRDFQVKIRGFRVEASEIERVLLSAGVQDAIVVSPKRRSGEAYLAAFVVGEIQIDQLRDRICEALPDYMMPSQFYVLDELPRTPNGKVDRRALLSFNLESSLGTAPRTKLEHQLVQIWSEVLGLRSIGIDDRFFEIGGNSLAMAQIVAKIEQKLSVRLPVSVLFEASTIQELALLIESQKDAVQSPFITFHQSETSHAPLFCFPGAGSHFRFCQGLASHLRDPHPIYGVRELPIEHYDSIEALAADYVQLLKQAQPEGAYHLIGYSFGALVALEVAQQLRAQGRTIALLTLIDPSHPPIRFRSLRLLLKQFPSRNWCRVQRVLYRTEVHHLRLSMLNGLEKLNYIQSKLRLINSLSSRSPASEPLLNEVWQQYEFYLQLRDRYVPQTYDQPACLFFSEDRARDPGQWANWYRLLTPIASMSVSATNHHSICEEPSIREIVRSIELFLNRSKISVTGLRTVSPEFHSGAISQHS